MKYLLGAFFFFLSIGIQSINGQDVANEFVQNKFTIHSSILNEDRTCFISFPDSYKDSSAEKKTYPLIIILDGYTFFKTAAGVEHFMSSSNNRNYMMPETIIVAIENVDRERDFTVTKIKTKRPNTMGGGKNFLNFIEKELIPFIDMKYRTDSHRTLVGHSLGGLLSLNAFMDPESIFNAYLCIDPSIWWDETMMKEKVGAISPVSFEKRLYIATANMEERRFEKNKKRHDLFYDLIKIKSGGTLSVKLDCFDSEDHRSVVLPALYEGLKYLND